VHVLLRREGWEINPKRTHRLYREAGLQVRKRSRKRIVHGERTPLQQARRPNESWSMDFVADALANGRRIRCLTLVDDFTKECLATVPDTSITGLRVESELDQVIARRGAPACINSTTAPSLPAGRSTNGPTAKVFAFASSALASPSKTPTSGASTASFAMSA
jgi:putative transposase